jgi:hypothetical protein
MDLFFFKKKKKIAVIHDAQNIILGCNDSSIIGGIDNQHSYPSNVLGVR